MPCQGEPEGLGRDVRQRRREVRSHVDGKWWPHERVHLTRQTHSTSFLPCMTRSNGIHPWTQPSQKVTRCDETCEFPPCDHQSRRDTTPLPERYGCRVEAENAVPHDWSDEASRARRDKIEDKRFRAQSRKSARDDTHKSTQRTSEPKEKEKTPRTRAWVTRPSTCDAHRQRCTTPRIHGTDSIDTFAHVDC